MHALVATAWLFSAVFSSPQVAIFSYMEVQNGSGVSCAFVLISATFLLIKTPSLDQVEPSKYEMVCQGLSQ